MSEIKFSGVAPEARSVETGSGQEAQPDAFIRFTWYLATEWAAAHQMPDSQDEFDQLRSSVLTSHYREFLAGGGTLDFRRGGLTLKEGWIMNQLLLSEQQICILSPKARLSNLAGITRKVFLDQNSFIEATKQLVIASTSAIGALVVHRGAGHAIRLKAFDEGAGLLTFYDPWPGMCLPLRWNLQRIKEWDRYLTGSMVDEEGRFARQSSTWQGRPSIEVAPADDSGLWKMTIKAYAHHAYALHVPFWLWNSLLDLPYQLPLRAQKRTQVEIDPKRVMQLILFSLNANVIDSRHAEMLVDLYKSGKLGDTYDGASTIDSLEHIAVTAASYEGVDSLTGDDPVYTYKRLIEKMHSPSTAIRQGERAVPLRSSLNRAGGHGWV